MVIIIRNIIIIANNNDLNKDDNNSECGGFISSLTLFFCEVKTSEQDIYQVPIVFSAVDLI